MGFGGHSSVKAQTEIWNGSSWTEVGDLNTGRQHVGGAGANTTAALAFGGGPGYKTNTERWNGSSWTEVNDLNVMGGNAQSIGNDYNSVIDAGGGHDSTDYQATVEEWDGVSWTEIADLSAAKRQFGSGARGTTTSGMAISGQQTGGSIVATVEEWSSSSVETKVLTD